VSGSLPTGSTTVDKETGPCQPAAQRCLNDCAVSAICAREPAVSPTRWPLLVGWTPFCAFVLWLTFSRSPVLQAAIDQRLKDHQIRAQRTTLRQPAPTMEDVGNRKQCTWQLSQNLRNNPLDNAAQQAVAPFPTVFAQDAYQSTLRRGRGLGQHPRKCLEQRIGPSSMAAQHVHAQDRQMDGTTCT
jgi:hypothetical protein